jgi:hypothetical protein
MKAQKAFWMVVGLTCFALIWFVLGDMATGKKLVVMSLCGFYGMAAHRSGVLNSTSTRKA